jgi:proteasome accessory factor C
MADSQPQVQDRLAFLLAFVPYLLENDGVSVADAAAHFDLSEERVREAVSLIAVSGVPGESRQYGPNDLFDIDWDSYLDHDRIALTNQVAIDGTPRFSAREAAALIAGLQYLSALPENADRAAIATLTAKLMRGSSGAPSALAVASDAAPVLAEIRAALAGASVLRFDYLNGRGEREARLVEPLRVESVDETWYLRGWDQVRNALRTFRLDRMEHASVDDSVRPTPHDGDVELPDRIFSPSRSDLRVTIEIVESAVPLLADYLGDRPTATPSPTTPGWVRTTLRIAHLHGLKRLMASRAGLVRVVDPPEARRIVAEWAEAGAAQYGAIR